MVHRDFKPGNVLLGPDGPVVIDFGLATVPGMTTTGLSGEVAVGTPAFMAPEQLAGTRVNAAADMWSWAVTMTFAGTGELPFKGESLTATAYAILHSQPAVGWLPEPLGSLVRRCLNKAPALRPSARDTLGELVAAGARLMGPLPPKALVPVIDDAAPGSQHTQDAVPDPRHSSGGDVTGGPQSPVRRGSGRARWRWRPVAILTAILLVAGAGGLYAILPRDAPSAKQPTGSHAGRSHELAAEAAARTQAVEWVLQQVSRSAVVACDSQVCADLAAKGFPTASLLTLGPGSTDPLGSDLVIATAATRAQYGKRLASVYAPATIASFGSRDARIDIRFVFPEGTARYRAVQRVALRTRRAADRQLLANSRIAFSATARTQLLSGDIDPRLPLLIAAMATEHPVRVLDFGDQSPGGGPASLLRWADLATTGTGAHLTPAAYLDWMHAFLSAQRAQYHPARSERVTLRHGEAVFRVEYGAPSPLS